MSEHPCPFPKKQRWRRGRRWTCTCGKHYWLVEKQYYVWMDSETEWHWVHGTRSIESELYTPEQLRGIRPYQETPKRHYKDDEKQEGI